MENNKNLMKFHINSNPPVKPGILHRQARPFDTSRRVPSRKYGLTASRISFLTACNPAQIFSIVSCSPAWSSSIWLLYVLLYLFRILPLRVFIVPSAPNFPYHEAALFLQLSHKTCYQILRWNLYLHIYIIRAHFRFYNFHLISVTQRSQYFHYFSLLFSVESLSSILRCKC